MKHILGFINTPTLWSKEQFGLSQFELPTMNLASFKAQPISTKLRLGHQVEYIFKQLLEYSDQYEVIAHNIQIKRGKETIGELDFLVKERFRESILQQIIHIELTYKFYIIDPVITEPIHRLMGPNRKDMFFTKMEKTRDKQLPLLYSKECQEAMESLHINTDTIKQQTYFLAQLFTEYGKKDVATIRPLNKKCIVGFWVRFEIFNTSHFKGYEYYITKKNEWLHEPHLDVEWKSHFDIVMDINVKHIDHRAPLIWIKKPDTLEKGFVVWW